MENIEYYRLIATLIGGGAAGSIITAFVAAARNRIQPIGHRVEISPVFQQTLGDSHLRTKITMSDGHNELSFDNLFLVDIQIVNKGNRDVKEFRFGVNLSGGDRAVYVIPMAQDRLHKADVATPVNPATPSSEIDLVLKPFNRRDSYALKLYVVVANGKEAPENISLVSDEPIRFIHMPTIGEMVAQTARYTSIKLGPIRITASSP